MEIPVQKGGASSGFAQSLACISHVIEALQPTSGKFVVEHRLLPGVPRVRGQ
jgi:hypothetical protein